MVKISKTVVVKGKPDNPGNKPPTEPPPEPVGDPVSGKFRATVQYDGQTTTEDVEGTFSGHCDQSSGEFSVMGFLVKPSVPVEPPVEPTGWGDHKIGGGGFLVGMDMHPDGSMMVRADTMGFYLWSDADDKWNQLVTETAMPNMVPWSTPKNGLGGYECKFAPSNSNIIYLLHGGYLVKSINKGETFQLCAGQTRIPTTSSTGMAANYALRMLGPRMGVNPTDPNHVIFGVMGTPARQSYDGGVTFNDVPSVPTVVDASAGYFVCFLDANTIFISGYNIGLWKSTNGGASFAQEAGMNTLMCLTADRANGIMYGVEPVFNTPTSFIGPSKLWKWTSGGGWVTLYTNATEVYRAFAVNPLDTQHLAMMNSTQLRQSFDGGATWTDYWGAQRPTGGFGWTNNIDNAGEAPWLIWTNDIGFKTCGHIWFSPLVDGLLYQSEGIGVWKTQLPPVHIGSEAGRLKWYTQTRGIEQMVCVDVIAPPNGNVFSSFQDRSAFKMTPLNLTYPAKHAPDNLQALVHGYALDYASQNNNFIIASSNIKSCYSLDGGETWVLMPDNLPSPGFGGCFAAQTADNWVFARYNNGWVSWTKDRGVTWTRSIVPNENPGPETGYTHSTNFRRKIIAADRVMPNRFYLYGYAATGQPVTNGGFYRSNDGGETFIKLQDQLAFLPFFSFHARIKCVPGVAEYVLCAGGTQGGNEDVHPSTGFSRLFRSTNGGTDFAEVPLVRECVDFGFGLPAPGKTFPTVFLLSWMTTPANQFGVWMSTDFDNASPTWTYLGKNPRNTLDGWHVIEGDWSMFGRCHVGCGGSSLATYTP